MRATRISCSAREAEEKRRTYLEQHGAKASHLRLLLDVLHYLTHLLGLTARIRQRRLSLLLRLGIAAGSRREKRQQINARLHGCVEEGRSTGRQGSGRGRRDVEGDGERSGHGLARQEGEERW